MRRMNLVVVEGALDVAAALKLLRALRIATEGVAPIDKGGRIAFWRDAQRYNQAAAHLGPILGLADMEGAPCASALFRKHLKHAIHPNFILRLARPMLESWLMADAESLARYLKVSNRLVPTDPDNIAHPKKILVQIASKSTSRSIREDVVPRTGSLGIVGPRYTPLMAEYVRAAWRPLVAKSRSPTLCRAIASMNGAFAG